MEGTASHRRRPRRVLSRRMLSLCGAAAAHVLILALLALGIRIDPIPRPSPAIEVQLLREAIKPVPAPAAAKTRPKTVMFETRQSAKSVEPQTAAAVSPAAAPSTSRTPDNAPSDDERAAQAALRASIGCAYANLLDLTPAERERCLKQTHDRRQGASAYAFGPSDPSKRPGLEHAERVNDAWRSYRKSYSTTDYPGLRTLIPALKPRFGDEPAQPSSGP